MKRLSFPTFLRTAGALGVLSTLLACGDLSDPTKSGGNTEHTSHVAGALTGSSVPAGARVALVWRVGATGNFAVTNDVAVENGKFAMDLATPSAEWFFTADGGGNSAAVPIAAPTEGDTSRGQVGTASLRPLDNVSGGITQPMSVAVAGFVVYLDSNGNGKLDIGSGPNVASTDQIIGGDEELMLAYLKDGGALDYEKLRDGSGVAPTTGYNLRWDGKGRWVPLDEVELKLSASVQLPSGVCAAGESSVSSSDTPVGVSGGSGGSAPHPTTGPNGSADAGTGSYPPPNDPNLRCSPDGYSYSYGSGCINTQEPPAPTGLCGGRYATTMPCEVAPDVAISPDAPIPDGWPCPIGDASTGVSDGGIDATPPAPDAGM